MKRVIALLAAFACHHDAPAPAEPAGTPPLPPASGTPIGYLVDAAAPAPSPTSGSDDDPAPEP